MKTILITGATGFIGRQVALELLKGKNEIICTGRSLKKLNRIFPSQKNVSLNICDLDATACVIQSCAPDVIVHCAAETKSNSLKKLMKTNAVGTQNLFEAALKANVSQFILISSISAIAGNSQAFLTDDLPLCATTNYGLSKIEAEKIAHDYRQKGLKIEILRPALVYGEADHATISMLVDLVRWGLFPIVGDGQNRIPLVYIENVVDVILLAIEKEVLSEGTYIISDRESVSSGELLEYIASLWGKGKPLRLPSWFIPFLTSLPFFGGKFKTFFDIKICHSDRLKEVVNYVPQVSLYEGIKRVVESHKKNSARLSSSPEK